MSVNCITTRDQYDEVRNRVNELIKEATQKVCWNQMRTMNTFVK